MSRFATLATLNVNDALPDAWVDEVKVLHDYLALAGADLASAGTIAITAEYHRVTGSTQITTINDASTQNKGQIVRLHLVNGTAFGTSGNITTLSGSTSTYPANSTATFMWDGTSKWLEVGVGDPLDLGQIAIQQLIGSLGVGGGQLTLGSWNGIGLDRLGGILSQTSGAGNYSLQIGVNADTQPRLAVLSGGGIRQGPGGSTTPDTSIDRSAAGRVSVGNVEAQAKLTATYSTSITLDARAAKWQVINVTNATAFTINAPSNPPGANETQDLTIEIVNSSGGSMGAITWNSTAFRPLSAGQPVNYANPANGARRAVHWRWNGAWWVWVGANSIDYS